MMLMTKKDALNAMMMKRIPKVGSPPPQPPCLLLLLLLQRIVFALPWTLKPFSVHPTWQLSWYGVYLTSLSHRDGGGDPINFDGGGDDWLSDPTPVLNV
jgi:hypothetical protein